MSEPLGTSVNLRELLNSEGLKLVKKGNVLHFENHETGDETWIRVVRAGFLRYEGIIVRKPLTGDEFKAEQDAKALEAFDDEEVKVVKKPRKRKEKIVST